MKIKYTIGLGIVLASMTANATVTQVTGNVTRIEAHSANSTDQAACEVGINYVQVNNNWYWFPQGGDDAKSILAQAQTALATGMAITLHVTDQLLNCPGQYRRITVASLGS